MSDIFNDQRKFMRACGQTTDQFDEKQYRMYCDLIAEEIQELRAALHVNDSEQQLDALVDILVVTAGALHSFGVDADGAWKEVMRSNFDKVDPRTGRVNKRDDGKVLKPEGWQPPALKKFIAKR